MSAFFECGYLPIEVLTLAAGSERKKKEVKRITKPSSRPLQRL